ncbi:MAG TPA: hypothetical protein VD969_10570 [Symbiobacteriaceae bacterium]|nr:hypothetical protein [Symbiobacteriaceae bacterium]
MIDQGWEGSVSEVAVVTVDGDPLRGALDTGRGDAGIVPPTLPATWWQQIPQPWLSDDLRLVLREQTIDLLCPLVPGERLNCTIRLERIRRRGAHQYLTACLEARSAGSALVARAVSHLVVIP